MKRHACAALLLRRWLDDARGAVFKFPDFAWAERCGQQAMEFHSIYTAAAVRRRFDIAADAR